MPTVALYNIEGKQIGDVNLKEEVFGVDINVHAMHEAVRAQLANSRQGTQSALTRAEVSGGGKKPWRQKGTGRARHGSIRSPQWRKGGVVFAPKPRDYSIAINKKVKRLAIKSALTSKVRDNDIIVLENLDIPTPKTKEMVKLLNNFDAKKALIVMDTPAENARRAAQNIQGVKTTPVNCINVYDILKYDKFILTLGAVNILQEVYAE